MQYFNKTVNSIGGQINAVLIAYGNIVSTNAVYFGLDDYNFSLKSRFC